VGYILTLPIVAAGFALTLILLSAQKDLQVVNDDPFAPTGAPTHPVVEPLAFGDWETRIAILFLATVVAPLVEEIMFRGVLFRHLREASFRLGRLFSFLFS